MAEPKVALRNIRSIGTIDDPVEVIHVKIIQQLENLSHELSTMGAGTETFAGQTFDTGTNAITMIENTIMSGTFQTTGIFTPAGHINLANQTYFINGDGLVNKGMTVTTAGKVVCKQGIGVTGLSTMAAITASGLITANGGVTLGANMTTGTKWIRGSGGNVGQKFTGANVEFSGTVQSTGFFTASAGAIIQGANLEMDGNNIDLNGGWVNSDGSDNKGIRADNTGNIFCEQAIEANGDINCTSGAFQSGGNSGVTTTIDFSTYAGTITISRGIITVVP